MGYNFFNYAAFLLLLILLITTAMRKMTRGQTNVMFIRLTLIILLADFLDIISTHFQYHLISMPMFLYKLLMVLNLAVQFHIGLYFSTFIVHLTGKWHGMSKQNRILMAIPFIFQIIMLLINLGSGFIYTFAGTQIVLKPLFKICYISTAFYILFALYHLLRNQKRFEKEHFTPLILIFPTIVISIILQHSFINLRLAMFIYSICTLFISMAVVRPEEIIDDVTSLKKTSAYANDMKKNFDNNRHVDVIVINISNHDSLDAVVGYENMKSIKKMIANKLLKTLSSMNVSHDIYFLDPDKYRVVIYGESEQIIQIAASAIKRSLLEVMHISEQEINLLPYVCTVRCPEDIDDFPSLMAFGSELHKRFDYTTGVMKARDSFDKKRYDILQDIDKIIDHALVFNEFEVYYQPIYSVKEKRFNSAEALLRMKTEKYGFVSPELFIPCAEQSGAIHAIGKFVLEEVCKFIASDEFKQLGIDYIEVNLSVAQCMQNGLAEEVINLIDKYGISTSQINLEITETTASRGANVFVDNLNRLRSVGILFSLDDYGTGYSNMVRVASLPLEIVKLDRAFTLLKDNPRMLVVLESTVKMLKELEVKIVVEGVETEDVFELFSKFGCDYIQGFYFSRPIPKDDFIKYIMESKEETA